MDICPPFHGGRMVYLSDGTTGTVYPDGDGRYLEIGDVFGRDEAAVK